jgi:hypothetical protein
MAHKPWKKASNAIRRPVTPASYPDNPNNLYLSMHPIVSFLISQTILIPLIIGVIRFPKIDSTYYPFILLLLMGFTAEAISFICRMGFHARTDVPINIYGLIECIILLFQFHTWGFLRHRKSWFYLLLTFFILTWITENIIFGKIEDFALVFRVSYCFAVTLLCINQINYMIVQQDGKSLFVNAKFLICISLIIYCVYEIIYDAAYFIGKNNSAAATKIIDLFNYMNATVNLLFGVAALLIPEKKSDLYFNRHFE